MWQRVVVTDDELVVQGEVRWRRGKGWEADCTECDRIVGSGFRLASRALLGLETHVATSHGDDLHAAGR